MAHRKTLTVEQADLLRWIDHGCPVGVMSGTGHRVSAAALARRHLVTTTGNGNTWSAQLTDAGRDYLRRLDETNPPPARQSNHSVTEQLVHDVTAAGGTLVVTRSAAGVDIDYDRRARLAELHGKVPDGKRLRVTPAERGHVRIELLDGPSADERAAIAVPKRATRLHPAVQAFRDNTDRQRLSRATVSRSVRILQALATAAESQGMTVTGPATPPRPRRGALSIVSLHLELNGHRQPLQIFEEGIPNHGYADRWAPGPYGSDYGARTRYEAKATGKLSIELVGGLRSGGRPGAWRDRKGWQLDDRLADVLWEIRLRVAEEQERERQAQITADLERQAWEAAMYEARRAFLHQHRADRLIEQLQAWELAERIRSYCAALTEKIIADPELERWITWSLNHADSIDPTVTITGFPADPSEPGPTVLQPFLSGWSAYGPDRTRFRH